MQILIGIVAVIVGVLNTVQAGASSTLGKSTGSPFLATVAVAAGGIAVYLVAGVFTGYALPSAGRLQQVPWWAWFGGVLGALYVLAMIFLAQKLGSAVFTGLSVTAAVLTTVLLDHFGLVGFQQHAAGLWRIAGCALMIGGLALVSIF